MMERCMHVIGDMLDNLEVSAVWWLRQFLL
jgi:hypothetical protein